MTMVRWLGAVAGLFAGMMAGLACVVFGLLASVAAPDPAPQASRDPVARFDLAIVSPPEVNADPPVYQPIRDRLEQAGLFAVIAHSALPALARLTAPTERLSGRIDRTGIRRVAGVELFDILGVVALEEGTCVELTVRALFVHFSAGRLFGPLSSGGGALGCSEMIRAVRSRPARISITHQSP